MTKYAWIMGFGFVFAGQSALADDDVTLKYRFRPGQVLLYDGKQSLTVESSVAGTTQKFASETVSMREWRVLAVDGKGNARLAMTIGYRVFVCDNMAFHGDFSPVLAKHSKHFNLLSALSVGVDQMQRSFDPMVIDDSSAATAARPRQDPEYKA